MYIVSIISMNDKIIKILKDLGIFTLVLTGTILLFGDLGQEKKVVTVDDMADRQKEFLISKEFNQNIKKYIPDHGEAQKDIKRIEKLYKFN